MTHGGAEVIGAVVGDQLVDLRDRAASTTALLERVHRGEPVDLDGAPTVALDEVTWLPPVAAPRRILCVGVNYFDHLTETGRGTVPPGHPVLFTRFASSLVGHREPIVRPTVSTSYDYEGELAIVIGHTVRHADRDAARAAIGGYSCFMDGTVRDYQRHTSQFTPGKNFDRSGAWGPWIVTADEVPDPYALQLTTTVDGAVVQSAMTSQLMQDLEAIVVYVSTFTTLEPGDVIATGTPGGVGFAKDPPAFLTPGTTVRVAIDGVGSLENTVVDEGS